MKPMRWLRWIVWRTVRWKSGRPSFNEFWEGFVKWGETGEL